MLLQTGEKVHVAIRRFYPEDLRRHFAGEVLDLEGSVARLSGYFFIFSSATGKFLKRPDRRVSIFDLAESGYLVSILELEVDIDTLRYSVDNGNAIRLTDGKAFSMDISEFGPRF